MKMKNLTIVLLAATIITACGGASQLTRSQAGEIIAPLLAKTDKQEVLIGIGQLQQDGSEPMYRALEKAGIVKIDGQMVTLTNKGHGLSEPGNGAYPDRGLTDSRSLTFLVPTFSEITGILEGPDGKTAMVDFIWKWGPSEITRGFTAEELAKYLPDSPPGKDYTPYGRNDMSRQNSYRDKAQCQLYDDGWRCSLL